MKIVNKPSLFMHQWKVMILRQRVYRISQRLKRHLNLNVSTAQYKITVFCVKKNLMYSQLWVHCKIMPRAGEASEPTAS